MPTSALSREKSTILAQFELNRTHVIRRIQPIAHEEAIHPYPHNTCSQGYPCRLTHPPTINSIQRELTFVSFISLICQKALRQPAFQIFRIVRPIAVPWDLYPVLIGGWTLSTEEVGTGFPNVPGTLDVVCLAGTLDVDA